MQHAALKVDESSAITLTRLQESAATRRHPQAEYAGEVTPEETFAFLSTQKGLLIDVRTHPEWLFVGVPEVEGISRVAQVSWKNYPTFASNPQFMEQLQKENINYDTPLFFICRSGGRSLDAAAALTAQGYKYCFNVTGGFEGEPDMQGHRSSNAGWKHAGLPWRQG